MITNLADYAVYSRLTLRHLRSNFQKQMCTHRRGRKNILPTARRRTEAEVVANILTPMQTRILPRRTPTCSMAQTAAAPIHLPFLLLQMIMPLPLDTRRGPFVCVPCRSLSLWSYLFFLLCCPCSDDDILGDLFFSIPVLRLCCLSRFSCAFYLTNIYCKVVCCYPILF